jgi:formate transporter
MAEIYGSDAFSPDEIAQRVEKVGVSKASLPLVKMVALGVLAGGFIGLGAMFYTLVAADAELSFSIRRILGGLAFSLGLILVVVAGAELYTGNNLMVMAWVSRKISLKRLLRNLVIVYFANFIGAAGLAAVVAASGHLAMNDGEVGETAVRIAEAKLAMPFLEAFLKGVLCNILVCLAVWLAMAGRSVVDRIAAVVFPITAFVAAGFEHCVANFYFVPVAMFSGAGGEELSWADFWIHNQLPVTLGNTAGGAGMVGLVYWIIYHHRSSDDEGDGHQP